MPVRISGSFDPGASIEVGGCGKSFPFVMGCHSSGSGRLQGRSSCGYHKFRLGSQAHIVPVVGNGVSPT